MSNIDKQELREAAERAESDSWGYDRDEFNEALTPSTVLALLDELEAKDKQIADLKEAFRIRRQKAVNEFYDAFDLSSIEPGTTVRLATKGDLTIMMYRTEGSAQ